MQNKLLAKQTDEQQILKQTSVADGYYSMKDEESQIEMNPIKKSQSFLSGSEDESEEKKEETQDSIIRFDPSNGDHVVEDKIPKQKEPKVRTSPDLDKTSKKNKQKLSPKKKKEKKKKQKITPIFKWSTYKFLLAYPMRHKLLTMLTNVLIIATAVIQAYLPKLIGDLLDSTTQNKNQERHSELSERFFKILVIYGFMQFIRAFTNQIWQELIYNDMREDVLKRFLSFDISFFNSYRNGEIISRMTNDLASAKSAVSGNFVVVARNIIMVFVDIGMLFSMSWKLTLAILSTMPVFTLISMFYSRLSKQFEKQTQENQAQLTSVADEIVTNILTVKSFCAEDKETIKFRKQLKKNIELAYKKGLNNGVYQGSSSFFMQFGSLIALWYGGKLVMEQNELTPGEIQAFIIYSVELTTSSFNLSDAYAKIMSATGAFEGVLQMLKYQNNVQEKVDSIEHIQVRGGIQFQKVDFEYPNTNVSVINKFDLTIPPGEYVAFVGPSGSGKSTLVQLLERFYDPKRGKILLDGIDIKDFKLKDLRKQIGLVSQEPQLFEGSIESNIIYGIENYTYEDLVWATKAAGVWQFVNDKEQFPDGFKTFVGEHGYTLSGGQKQRIAIARALIKRPKILIFDEATSALDAESEYGVQSAIDELIQTEKKSITILVIAHRLSTIVNCNRIIVLQKGYVVEQGSHQELIQLEGIYKSLVERQMVDTYKSDGEQN
ncbi:hypothetical protein pb186bvf_010453 [Paramecium bursaria]